MKIYIISNTYFGYKGIVDEQFSYFNDKIIPFIEKNYIKGDILVHGGNIFYNRKTVNMDIIHNTMNIFEKLSNILPIYIIKSKNDDISTLLLSRIKNVKIVNNIEIIDNVTLLSNDNDIDKLLNNDIIIFNIDYIKNIDFYKNTFKNFNICVCTSYDDKDMKDDFIFNIGSPYQLNKFHKNKKGFLIIESFKKKIKFIENSYSPKFLDLQIENINDLEDLKISKKDYINLNIDEKLIQNKENLNKLNIAINKYNFKNVTYLKSLDPIENINDIDNVFDIKNLIDNYIKNKNFDLSDELNNVYEIFNSLKN